MTVFLLGDLRSSLHVGHRRSIRGHRLADDAAAIDHFAPAGWGSHLHPALAGCRMGVPAPKMHRDFGMQDGDHISTRGHRMGVTSPPRSCRMQEGVPAPQMHRDFVLHEGVTGWGSHLHPALAGCRRRFPLPKCTVISVLYEGARCREGRRSGREERSASRWIASNDQERSARLAFSLFAQVSALRTSCALRQRHVGGQ